MAADSVVSSAIAHTDKWEDEYIRLTRTSVNGDTLYRSAKNALYIRLLKQDELVSLMLTHQPYVSDETVRNMFIDVAKLTTGALSVKTVLYIRGNYGSTHTPVCFFALRFYCLVNFLYLAHTLRYCTSDVAVLAIPKTGKC